MARDPSHDFDEFITEISADVDSVWRGASSGAGGAEGASPAESEVE
jgi:hypothetical protein